MNKWLDGLYRYYTWVIIGLSLLAYFAYSIIVFNASIQTILLDFRSYIHLAFVVFLNVTMVDASYDTATSTGIMSDEFTLADELNNKIITVANNEIDDLRKFVTKLNEAEKKSIQDDYLFSVGKKTYEELDDKEKIAYDKLKPIQHNIYGFTLPLYYEVTKNGKISYVASIKKNEGKRKQQFIRAITGFLFGLLTIDILLRFENFLDALISLFIIGSGLVITFAVIFFPQVFKFKYELPKKVLLKKTLWDSYNDYKNGTHKLVKFELEKPKDDTTLQDND